MPTSSPKECRNVSPQSCAGSTIRVVRGDSMTLILRKQHAEDRIEGQGPPHDFGRLVVTYDRCAPFRQQPRKQTIAAADVQDALLAQIAQYLLDSGKMQPSAEGVFLDVACVVLDLAEVGHGAILVAETYSRNPG